MAVRQESGLDAEDRWESKSSLANASSNDLQSGISLFHATADTSCRNTYTHVLLADSTITSVLKHG
jgi:hypothetical protein